MSGHRGETHRQRHLTEARIGFAQKDKDVTDPARVDALRQDLAPFPITPPTGGRRALCGPYFSALREKFLKKKNPLSH